MIYHMPDYKEVPLDFLNNVISLVKDKINAFVIDVAQKEDGGWIVIELNDLCQSGLSCNDPNILYENLKKVLISKGV